MQLKGKAALSNAELIAIIIGSGNTKETAVELSQKILKSVNDNLTQLGKSSIKELMKFKGIGEAKAISIAAALEIGRRRQLESALEKPQVTSSKDVADFFSPILSDLSHEEFWVLYLNHANKIMGSECISTGGIAGTVADLRILYKKAIESLASGIIVAHNHPSGALKPSQADISLTNDLSAAGKILKIPLLDHIIIAGKKYYSFADAGML
ncbi:UNVERIFIED_CONTAM: hypothetical protein GTU68_040301 [Idotea baltica]|nr:hypothetical protein [Idotea baltica]